MEKVMWFQYVGAKTRESVVLEMAHTKYEFSEANDYKCALPSAHMMDIIPMEKRDMFVPCQAPEPKKPTKPAASGGTGRNRGR